MNRGNALLAAVALALFAFVAGTLIYTSSRQAGPQHAQAAGLALANGAAPTLGKSDARVHIVEFMDPACETCALFYPEVKRLMAANPGRIRLSVRHVAFHKGAEHAVRALEAARAQDKYWEALEALLANQDAWVVNHRVQPDRVWAALAPAKLDLERLRRDMDSPEVTRRIAEDLADARALAVTKTPEYFVNGRQMDTFGLEQLQALVRSELGRAYR